MGIPSTPEELDRRETLLTQAAILEDLREIKKILQRISDGERRGAS